MFLLKTLSCLPLLVLGALWARADDQTPVSVPHGRSPGDDYYEVVFLPGADKDDSTQYQFAIVNLQTHATFYTEPAGGYVSLSAVPDEVNCKCLWSPDGRFVAVYLREQKRGGHTSVYSVSADKVEPVKLPDLDKLLLPRIGPKGRSFYVRPELWGPDHELVLCATGLRLSLPESFRFVATLQLGRGKDGRFRARLKSVREDHAIEWWHQRP